MGANGNTVAICILVQPHQKSAGQQLPAQQGED